MPAQTTNLFLLEDLEDAFVAEPHEEIGRPGAAIVPGPVERRSMWLAPERVGDRSVADLVQIVNGAQPGAVDDAICTAILVAFTDVSADRANDDLNDVRGQDLNRPAYATSYTSPTGARVTRATERKLTAGPVEGRASS